MFSAIPLAGQDSGTYTHTGLDGIILAKSDTWYYEEFDTAGRPVEGVRWEKNEIVEKTTWSYFDDTQRIRQSVTTTDELITETRYDRNGNVIEIRETIVPPEEGDEEVNLLWQNHGKKPNRRTVNGLSPIPMMNGTFYGKP